MIPVKDLVSIPKDANVIVSRKNDTKNYKIEGYVVNKMNTSGYNIEVQMDTKRLTPDSNVKVYCSCPDFKFRCAYPLSLEGALLNPNRFQLTPANKTNPNNIMKACKHLHTFMKLEMERKLREFSQIKDEM